MQRTFLIIGIAMAALFTGCGFVFLCSNFLIERLPTPERYYLGVVFLLYGGFRAYRQYNQYKKMNEE